MLVLCHIWTAIVVSGGGGGAGDCGATETGGNSVDTQFTRCIGRDRTARPPRSFVPPSSEQRCCMPATKDISPSRISALVPDPRSVL